jgi:protein gp37
MAEQTQISWADATFNPWLGCQAVSPACDHCYAEELCTTRLNIEWGPHGERRRTAASTWKKLASWNRHPEKLNAPEGTKPFVFGGSLCDVFDNRVPPEWRADYFEAIRAAPNLLFLLLTKRPQNIVRMVKAVGFMPPNIAFGTTVEDRARRNNLAHLSVAAGLRPAFLFASFEPLLEDVGDITPWLPKGDNPLVQQDSRTQSLEPGEHFEKGLKIGADGWPILPALAWVIGGGESGRKARPAEAAWFRSLRDQTQASGAIYHHKQNGSRGPDKGGKMLDGELLQARPRVPA